MAEVSPLIDQKYGIQIAYGISGGASQACTVRRACLSMVAAQILGPMRLSSITTLSFPPFHVELQIYKRQNKK